MPAVRVDSWCWTSFPFVRGLAPEQRIDPPTLADGLHIVTVPSSPLSKQLEPVDIEGKWQRLVEIVQELPFAVTLERIRPSTIGQLSSLIANQGQRVVHFWGYGRAGEHQDALLIENEQGVPQSVLVKDFFHAIHGSAFLVMFNACAGASQDETGFTSLANVLAEYKIPYTLEMRFNLYEADTLIFERVLFEELARGTTMEEAVLHARQALARNNPRKWVTGMPVLSNHEGSE